MLAGPPISIRGATEAALPGPLYEHLNTHQEMPPLEKKREKYLARSRALPFAPNLKKSPAISSAAWDCHGRRTERADEGGESA